jgi:hypothetical protein
MTTEKINEFLDWLLTESHYPHFFLAGFREEIRGKLKELKKDDIGETKEQLPLDFVKWYSGMREEKIMNAYKRYLNENSKRLLERKVWRVSTK